MFPRNHSSSVEVSRKRLIQNFIDQGTFARTADSRHRSHNAKRHIYIYLFQIVFCCSTDFQPAGRLFTFCRYRNFATSAQVSTCNWTFILHQHLCRTNFHQFSTMFAGSRTDIHNTVRCAHGIFIMFNHNQTVTQITKTHQCTKKLIIISLMKSDTRFIQNISDSHQSGTNLCCQTDSLCFPTGQRRCCTAQRQIIQTYLRQKTNSCTDFFQNLLTDQFLLFSKSQLTHKFLQIFYRKRSHFINIAISYRHRQRFFF